MAYDGAAERIRDIFIDRLDIVEKKMFGGLAFMVRGHMCCGIINDVLMARVGPDEYSKALNRSCAREMDFTGKPLKGFVYVDPDDFGEDSDLQEWVEMCERFIASLPPK
jgi:TfoX/Sxy family transcriptional regulator of competence genes